jgi:hypothetical protein
MINCIAKAAMMIANILVTIMEPLFPKNLYIGSTDSKITYVIPDTIIIDNSVTRGP